MRVALIGQPNCGKSTLFNQVAGYKAETGNFTGTTVTFTESSVRVAGEVLELVDLPGTYTLAGTNPAEREASRYLLSEEVDVIINVLDASHISQGLELTLELLAMKMPVVVALNMMDEASRLGVTVDGPALEEKLGVPVLPLIASRGQGVSNLFLTALNLAKLAHVDTSNYLLLAKDNRTARHLQARALEKEFVKRGERRLNLRDRIDDFLLHSLWGYVGLVLILYTFFQLVYGIGVLVEAPLLAMLDNATQAAITYFGAGEFLTEVMVGGLQGVIAGVGIVLPYLVPFLLGLGLLEDIGYMSRVAFLMDALMHRIGLHGKAIVPFILGYGCNVPAVMSTRVLDDPKERFVAAALATLVPCAAILSVVFGLVAFYMGPMVALILYLLNIFVIALVGRILTAMIPEDTPGLILEIPPYRIPTARTVVQKAWFRIKEFLVEAWPLLIAGSVLLSIANYFNWAASINMLARPITWILDLPAATGVPLIFGIFRKELSLVMLGQALGSMNFSVLLTPVQMISFTVFVMFYIPCLATLGALRRELGTRDMLIISALTIVIATVTALFSRGVATIFF
ncbi:MAG: ferrous iron transporter B [Anaerolineae bacterium]|jgi:small GTP-binding protein|nr:ferrous iron transporter B [Anaerolineae bacterium]MBT7072787.1 ferrous iron transporter B [Anaerolineae bacterium]MBT7323790.1 ferrous iron transporter B [Anaerolineae bacterium]